MQISGQWRLHFPVLGFWTLFVTYLLISGGCFAWLLFICLVYYAKSFWILAEIFRIGWAWSKEESFIQGYCHYNLLSRMESQSVWFYMMIICGIHILHFVFFFCCWKVGEHCCWKCQMNDHSKWTAGQSKKEYRMLSWYFLNSIFGFMSHILFRGHNCKMIISMYHIYSIFI